MLAKFFRDNRLAREELFNFWVRMEMYLRKGILSYVFVNYRRDLQHGVNNNVK